MMGMERICLEADFDQATMPRPTIEQSNIPCGLQGEATSLMTSATMLRCDKNSQESTHTHTHTHTHTERSNRKMETEQCVNKFVSSASRKKYEVEATRLRHCSTC